MDQLIEDGPVLRMLVTYSQAPIAREAGQMIERLANAFNQEMKIGPGRRAQLALDQLSVSSLLAHFKMLMEVGQLAITLVEQRTLMIGFVERVALLIQSLREASGGSVEPAIRNFLFTFVTPVAVGRADSARLHVVGDNNIIINIEKADATELLALLRPYMPSRSGGSGVNGPPFHRDGGSAAYPHPIYTRDYEERYDPGAVDVLLQVSGVAYNRDGTWRVKVGGDVMPLVILPEFLHRLDLSRSYQVRGVIENVSGTRSHMRMTGFVDR